MAFPTTGILDDFNRANNADIGANWTPNPFNNAGNKSLVINSNSLGPVTPEAYSAEWYHATTYGPDVECYITVVARPSGSFASVRLDARLTNPSASSSTANSYRVRFMTANNDGDVMLLKVTNASESQLGATATQVIAAGDSIGIAVYGSTTTTIEAWHKPAAGSWTLVASRTDSTSPHTAAGFLAYHKNDSGATCRADDFGGGTMVAAGGDPEGLLMSGKLVGRGLLGGVLVN